MDELKATIQEIRQLFVQAYDRLDDLEFAEYFQKLNKEAQIA